MPESPAVSDSPRTKTILAVATAMLLVVGLLAVVAVGGDDPDKVDLTTSGAGSSTTTTAAGDTSVAAGEDGKDATSPDDKASTPGGAPTTVAGKTSGPTTAPPTTAAAVADPGPAQPAKVGTYAFEVTTDGNVTEGSLTVEALPSAPGETRQSQTRKSDEGSLTNEVVYRPDGIYLAKSSGSNGGGLGGDCDWEPDLLITRLPLAKQSTWAADSSCSGTSAYGPYTIKAHFEATVKGTARMAVGGQQVDVWVIDGTQRLDITASYQGQPIKVTSDSTSTSFYEPTRGLVVREESTVKTSGPQGNRTTSTVRQLKSLTPR